MVPGFLLVVVIRILVCYSGLVNQLRIHFLDA